MKFADTRRAGWDTETTGVNVHTDRIVTAAIVVRGGGKPDRDMSWVINPGVPIPEEVAEIHGFNDARVQAEGQDPASALNEIATRLADAIGWGMPLVAFNTAFDWSILHHELIRHSLPTLADRLGADAFLPLLDPIVIDKQYDRYVKGSGMRKLKPTAGRYEVELTDWHTAEADALAALLITEKQFERYPQLGEYSPQALFRAQQRWRGQQQTSLQAWLRKTEPDAVCEPDWPLIPASTEGATA